MDFYGLPQGLIGDSQVKERLQSFFEALHLVVIEIMSRLGHFAGHIENMHEGGELVVFPNVSHTPRTVAGRT